MPQLPRNMRSPPISPSRFVRDGANKSVNSPGCGAAASAGGAAAGAWPVCARAAGTPATVAASIAAAVSRRSPVLPDIPARGSCGRVMTPPGDQCAPCPTTKLRKKPQIRSVPCGSPVSALPSGRPSGTPHPSGSRCAVRGKMASVAVRSSRLGLRVQIGTRSVGQCQILGATSGGFDGLAVCGRPQARRLRRPASRLRGLTSATHRQVGIDATVAESGSLPRSDVSIVSDAVRRIQSRLSQVTAAQWVNWPRWL